MRGAKETRGCLACGKLLTRLVSQAKGKNWYCDHRCQSIHAPSPITVARESNPYRGQQETRPCALCARPTTRYLSQRRMATSWYCSSQCQGVAQQARRVANGTWMVGQKRRRGTESPCEQCGAAVYANQSQRSKGQGRFCSYACHNQAQTKTPVIKACGFCGTELRLKPSQAARQFCSKQCDAYSRSRLLDRTHNGRPARLDRKGYVYLWESSHPNKSYKGWQPEHRLVVESLIGRHLRSDEQVDHINQIKDDNRPENLQVLSAGDHSRKTVKDLWAGISAIRDELAEYKLRFGPLSKEE